MRLMAMVTYEGDSNSVWESGCDSCQWDARVGACARAMGHDVGVQCKVTTVVCADLERGCAKVRPLKLEVYEGAACKGEEER